MNWDAIAAIGSLLNLLGIVAASVKISFFMGKNVQRVDNLEMGQEKLSKKQDELEYRQTTLERQCSAKCG